MKRLEQFAPYLPYAVLALTLGVVFWRVWAGQVFYWGLPALQFVPWRAYGFEMLRAGHLPLWNPYNGGGAPLFANYQSAFLYPLNWPGLLMPSQPLLGWWMSVTAVLHLFLAGVGMGLYTARLGLPVIGRGVALLAFALTSYTMARLGTYPVVSAVTWLPFMLWAVLGIMQGGGGVRAVAWLGLFTGLLLTAGHAQTGWYVLLLAGLYALWSLGRAGWGRWPRLLWALLAVMLGVGLAGLQLLATTDLTLNSQRAGSYGEVERALLYSFRWVRLWGLVAPNFFGNPGDGSTIVRGVFYEYGAYVGVIPLIGAFAAVWAWISKRNRGDLPLYMRDVPFWAGVALVGLVLGMGSSTPLYPFLYRHVPTFDMFQAPVRWLLWLVMAMAILGGIGAAQWGTGRRVISWTRRALMALLALVMILAVAPVLLPAAVMTARGVDALIQALLLAGVYGLLAALLTLVKPGNVRRQRLTQSGWTLAVLLVLAFDLGWAARGLNPTTAASFYTPLQSDTDPMTRTYWQPAAIEAVMYGQQVTDDEITFLSTEDMFTGPWVTTSDYRAAVDDPMGYRASGLPNLNLLDKQYVLNNFDPLLLQTYADTVAVDEPDVTALGVTEIVTLAGVESVEDPSSRLTLAGESASVAIRDGYNHTEIMVTGAVEAGALTLWDVNAPGWRVTVNGEAATITLEGGFGRTVAIPAGDSVVRFDYRPDWIWPGITLSGGALLVLIGLFVVGWRQALAINQSE